MTDSSSIARRFQGERILLSGGTGFLAKSVLERLLSQLPGVTRIHLLIRPREGKTLADRAARDIFGSAVFDHLRRAHGPGFEAMLEEKVAFVEGDLTRDRLGMDPEAYERLASDVTLVLHCAAACSFDEPLDQALQTNTLGAGRMLRFAQDAGNAPMVHLSTCYVGATHPGLFTEEVLPPGHTHRSAAVGGAPAFDLDQEVEDLLAACAEARSGLDAKDATDAILTLGRARASLRGWHDVYQFTKALGEQLLARGRGSVPLCIVRPSIIESTYDAPRPGWIDGVRMADPIIVEYGKGTFLRFVGSVDTVLDLVPCDMVSNLVLAAAPPRGGGPQLSVYHLASGAWHPVTLGELTTWAYEAFTELARRHPDRFSPPARRGRWIPEGPFRAELRRKRRLLLILRRVHAALGRRQSLHRTDALLRAVDRAERLTDLYAFYTCSSPRFDVTRTRRLLADLGPEDRARFPFDLATVDWRDYLKNRHIPGLLRLQGFEPQ